MISRSATKDHRHVVNQLAKLVHELWMKADCCPSSIRTIVHTFESEVWEKYRIIQKQGSSGRKHCAKRPKVFKQPTRRSARKGNSSVTEKNDDEIAVVSHDEVGIPEKKAKIVQTRSQDRSHNEIREKWDREVGNLLFDVKSDSTIKKQVSKGLAFDKDFYEDQQNERLQVMDICKVSKAFQEEERKRRNTETRRYLRALSACGMVDETSVSTSLSADEESISEKEDEMVTSNESGEEEYQMTSNTSIIETREQKKVKETEINIQMNDIGTQHQSTPKLFTRVAISHSNRKSREYNPKYLQAIGMMMSEGLSAPQAIKSAYLIDTIVWEQDRFLPLHMDKSYKNAYLKLKKLQKQKESTVNLQIEDEIIDSDEEILEAENQDSNTQGRSSNDRIDELKRIVDERKALQEKNHMCTLPDTRTARNNHFLMSVYVEGKIGEEMVEKGGCFIIPDGTTRNKLGDIAAMLVKVGDKMRAVKAQKIGKGDRIIWADTIIHMLTRLSLASRTDIKALWTSIRSILSDLCKVNKSLGNEIKGIIGSEWEPGQLFCVLHFVLAIPEAIKFVFSKYQETIGSDKLFPETTGFEMNVDEKIMVVQVLDIWMRLTSIRWHGRAWNKYESFTKYAEEHGMKNVGHMIHANRFGEFEERCAGGVYLSSTWMQWLQSYTNIRNNLSCYLRTVIGLNEICVFQWCAAALVGLHLTAPFMSMLIDHKVTQRQLLIILPNLHTDLCTYPLSFIDFERAALPSLSEFWLPPFEEDTSPYGVEVLRKLKSFTEGCDQDLLDKCLEEICKQAAVVLKRQRGDAYGFGDIEDSPDLIVKNLSEEMLDDPDATNTKKIENYLGNLDRYLTTTGPQGFDKATDDLILKYGKDLLLEAEMKWTSKENRKAAKDLKLIQKEFDEKQKALKRHGLEDADIAIVTTVNKVQRVVAQCKKSHTGPIADKQELHDLVKKFSKNDETEKKLHSVLNLEIRYRKFTMTNIKDICPLFKQKGISIEEKVKNIELLLESQSIGLNATATMEDLENAIMASKDDDLIQESERPTEFVEQSISSSFWPPRSTEFLLALLEDGFYVGQIEEIEGEEVQLNFLVPKNGCMEERKFWVWPDREDKDWIKRDCIMEIYPSLRIETRMSTKRQVVYELMNSDIINIFIQFC